MTGQPDFRIYVASVAAGGSGIAVWELARRNASSRSRGLFGAFVVLAMACGLFVVLCQ